MATTSNPTLRNHYEILGIMPSASEAEIRGAFKRLARKYHPDKRTSELEKLSNPQTYDEHSDALAGTGATNFDEMFSLLANAYSVLSDGVERAAYDLELMGSKKTSQRSFTESLKRLRALRKQDAELQIRLMEVTSEQRRESEQKKAGLVFVEAWYGVSYAVEAPQKHPHEVVEVTRQLQTLVEGSHLVLPKGESKATAIPGVFDPCPENSDKSLKVKYMFKGKIHMTTVQDDELIIVPMKAHLQAQNAAKRTDGKRSSSVVQAEEIRILMGPGSGQIVHRIEKKNDANNKNNHQSKLVTITRLVAFMGITFGVAGSIFLASSKTWRSRAVLN